MNTHMILSVFLLYLISISSANLFESIVTSINPTAFSKATPDWTMNPDHIRCGDHYVKRDLDTVYDINNDGDVELFFDNFIATYENDQSQQFQGASIAMVRGGEIAFSKGYGMATSDRPVDAETIYCAASVSKSFTATAIMQLVERGELDLNKDVNEYFPSGVQLRSRFKDDVITVGDLLTHTSGFEEGQPWTIVRTHEQLDTLEEFVKRRMPLKKWRTGTLASYSNHAFVAAGYLIELVTGMDFMEYVEENIFIPLNMTSSTFDQTKVEDSVHLAQEYIGNIPLPFNYYINIGPAGGLFTTANDLGKFMIAQLNGGEGANNGSRILQPATVALQQSEIYKNGLNIPGISYGFYHYVINNISIVKHDGDMPGYTAAFCMLPGEKTGFIILQNNKLSMRDELLISFMDSFYPGNQTSAPIKQSEHLKQVAGFYRDTRTDTSSYASLVRLLNFGFVPVTYVNDQVIIGTPLEDNGNMTFTWPAQRLQPQVAFKGDADQYVALIAPIATLQRMSAFVVLVPVFVSVAMLGTCVLSCVSCCTCLCRSSSSTITNSDYREIKNPESIGDDGLRKVIFGVLLLSEFMQITTGLILPLVVLLNGPLFPPSALVTIFLVTPYIVYGITVIFTAIFFISIIKGMLDGGVRALVFLAAIFNGIMSILLWSHTH